MERRVDNVLRHNGLGLFLQIFSQKLYVGLN